MGIMNYLRERMGKFLAIFIGAALLAFIVGEVVRSGGSFFRGDSNQIGSVDGESISYAKFKSSVDQNTEGMKQQYGQVTPQLTAYVEENTWNTMVSQTIVKKEIERLGLTVGEDEIASIISVNNPDQQIARQFSNQQTGMYDPARYQQFLGYLKTPKADTAQKNSWNLFVSQIIDNKKLEKYMAMATNGLYVNSLDAKDDYDAKNKLAAFKYVLLPYSSIADKDITLTDGDYQDYYNEHKSDFKNAAELRSFEYVSINAAPSKEDSAAVKAQVEKLLPEFKASTNDSAFVQVNAETKTPLLYTRKGKLDPKIDSIMFGASKGFVYGPYLSNGSYKIAKLVDTKVGPDSVKARHILLNPATEGSPEKAVAKADSLKKLIEGGKSFAELATMYSTDKTSAVKGGELGTFGRGTMIPVFEDAVFNGKKGDIKVVTSQFGVHLIQIEEQKGSSRVVEVAVIDKPLTASTTTQSSAYSKAQRFLGSLSGDDFIEEARKEGLTVKPANDVTGTASGIPGLQNARDMIRWVYKAKVGDFGDQVYTVGDQYVVPHVTAVKPEGTLSLENVKKQIQPAVLNKVKAKRLTEKLQSAENGASSMDQVAQKVGSKVVPVQNIVLANPVIPGLAPEYKLIGTIFGSKINKISKPIEGSAGVYVFDVDGFTNPAPLTNAVREKQALGQAIMQRSQTQILDALKNKANVKDYRAKFL